MKTMNPVKSPYAGKVKEIIVSNEMSVEFDEALVIIDISYLILSLRASRRPGPRVHRSLLEGF